ncbi:MAG: fluoride efflux transporter CrcB [Fimbriiglobus sp.]
MTDVREEAVRLAAVIVGGAAGSVARYAVGRLATAYAGPTVTHFPWHTFAINVVGSFLLGVAAVWYRQHPQPAWFLLLGTGFCGGFTTFSTFSLEAVELATEKGRPLAAVGYAVGSVAAGFLAAWAAVRLARG